MGEKILFAWSGGKDGALALHELLRSRAWEISALLTTVTSGYDRISMHGVSRPLLERQAKFIGFPLEILYIPQICPNAAYEERMAEILLKYKNEGVRSVAFGDIHLQEIRAYRERQLRRVGLKARFPLWGKSSTRLIRSFIELGFGAIVTCVDGRVLDGSFLGRRIDPEFVNSLPDGIDPSGENGEYHSFVYDGPIFQRSIPCEPGERVIRDAFLFCDIQVADGSPGTDP